jgi:CDP-diacylglycerol--glycerol-3-phosphate 3-phosphatidyltransferase
VSAVRHLPNILTFGRIFAIPLIVAVFFIPADWARWVAAGLFAAAAISDYLDGYLARAHGADSPLGKLMDPIADKMLVAATLFLLVAFGDVPGWHAIAAILILLREILISGLREFLAGMGASGVPVSYLAKWKTTIQLGALAILILAPALAVAWVWTVGIVLLWLSAVLTLITGWDYLAAGIGQMRAAGRG